MKTSRLLIALVIFAAAPALAAPDGSRSEPQ